MIFLLFTGATLIVPAVLYAYKKIRPLFSVSVNCWFCGAQTVVPYGNFNCWDCPSCEQYNGFKEDGDYNKPIPAQHNERLNFTAPASCQWDSSPVKVMKSSNQLCSACNYHQLVKIRLLANFTPTQEGQFEAEAEEYRRHLEEVYALCPSCDVQVKRTLLLQDSLLRPHLVGHPALTRWRVLARYSLPWKQRLRLILAVAASAASLYLSLTLLGAALGSKATLAPFVARLGLDRIGAPPLWLLQPAGFVLAGSSVLLSGRQRLGPVALLLCLLWLLSLSCSHLAAAFWDPLHLAWPQASLLASTAVVGAAHLLTLAKAQLHGGAVRKLVGSSRSSSLASSPCSSGSASPSASTYLASRSDSPGPSGDVQCSDTRSSSCSQRTAACDRPLPDMMSDVHISPESERSWSTSTWSKPTSLQGSSRGEMLGAGGGRTLVWPPRLHLARPSGSSWMAAGAWAVGGQRTSSNTQLLWGVQHSFGLLTPPPSLNGSAKHSDSSAAVSAAGLRHNTDWCFFRQRDAFFSSSPDFTSGSQGRVPSPRSRGLVQRAPTHQGTSQASRRGYARSSVSQASSSLVEPRGNPVTTGPAEPRRWLPSPTLGWLLLGISVLLNLSLLVYLAAWS